MKYSPLEGIQKCIMIDGYVILGTDFERKLPHYFNFAGHRFTAIEESSKEAAIDQCKRIAGDVRINREHWYKCITD